MTVQKQPYVLIFGLNSCGETFRSSGALGPKMPLCKQEVRPFTESDSAILTYFPSLGKGERTNIALL